MNNRSTFMITILLLVLAIFARAWVERRQNGTPKMELIPFEKPLGRWKGTDLKLDADVVEMLNPDQIVFRRYRNPSGGSVDVYGVFYGSQGAGRTMHSPLNCYPGSGWEIVWKGKVRLEGSGGDESGFEVRKLVLRKGLARRLLYYWYYAGGKTASDQYMNKLLTLYGALVNGRTDGGLITVSTIQDAAGLNRETVEKEFLPVLVEYLSEQPIGR